MVGPDLSHDFGDGFWISAKRFSHAKRFRAYVVFHALNVVGDDRFVETELAQETGQEFVPVIDEAGNFLPGTGQNRAAIFFVFGRTKLLL